jgi:simple sugar transport system permease protein
MSTILAAPRRRVVVEPRQRASAWLRVLVPIGSIIIASLVGALILLADGHSPVTVYKEVFLSGFGGKLPLIRGLMLATPLILAALAASIAFKMRLWNIGADGQLMIGAIAASGVALALSTAPLPILLPLFLVAGAVGGASLTRSSRP